MKPIRVLIVDDSAFVREFLTELLSADREIEVVGEACNGVEALEKIPVLLPDLVTMDIEMPEMNGMLAIEHIMGGKYALPILVITSLEDAHTGYEAIIRGALEVMPKPDIDRKAAEYFVHRVKLLSKVKVVRHIRHGTDVMVKNHDVKRYVTGKAKPEIIAIASSTGGPGALLKLFAGLKAPLDVPLVAAQHIAHGFDAGLVEWLNKETPNSEVKLGTEGERVKPGVIYISPSYGHMEINLCGSIDISPLQPDDIYIPSCDRLLKSVARSYGQAGMAIVLTGMGNDGTAGIMAIKKAGGKTIAQDEASSVIYGMPMAAAESGCIDEVLSLNAIRRHLNLYVQGDGP